MEPQLADETWGKLGGEIAPVPVVAPPEIAELMLFEAVWLSQLRLWLDLIEAWWAPGRGGVSVRMTNETEPSGGAVTPPQA